MSTGKSNRTNSNLSNGSGAFPVKSWPEAREESQKRRAEFPYRFPYDRRQLGGKFTVKENARRLMRYFYFERCLFHAIGGWTSNSIWV